MNPLPNTIEIIPGILEKEWSAIEQKIKIAQTFASTIHIDIIDGIFVDNQTFLDPAPFAAYSQSLYLELHMMVKDPIQYIEPFARVGFKRFIGHIEMMADQQAFIDAARKYGEAGLALDGPTPLEKIIIPFNAVDCFLIYTSQQVGFSGPPLLSQRLDKVQQLRAQTDKVIEVDGGMNDASLHHAIKAGATRVAATSFIFSSIDPEKNYQKLLSLGK